MMAGLTQEELGNFLQDEIFDPYLRASCGVNLDRGGGQLGSNMSSSTATGKFEIVRLSDTAGESADAYPPISHVARVTSQVGCVIRQYLCRLTFAMIIMLV